MRHISNNLIATILTLAGIAVWMLVQPPTVGGADGRTLVALVVGSVGLADWWQVETAPADEDQDNVAARPERVLAEGVLSRFAEVEVGLADIFALVGDCGRSRDVQRPPIPHVRGRVAARLDDDSAWPIIDRIATKYTGAPYPERTVRVVFLIDVQVAWTQSF